MTMTPGNSKSVTSSQTGIHSDLIKQVTRHQHKAFLKPIAEFNQLAFEQASGWIDEHKGPYILDSGCGVGDSTRLLAQRFPDHLVLGLDRSEDRLHRQRPILPCNARLLRTDLIDFWRLAATHDWHPSHHFLFYPNPYPKPSQLTRRFHAHPSFRAMIALGGQIEARSNWRIYLEELQCALQCYGIESHLAEVDASSQVVSAFERKYRDSGQTLWQLITQS